MTLKDVPTKQSFVEAFYAQLDTILLDEQDVETAWITLPDSVYSTAMDCLGPSSRRQRDWLDENHAEIMGLIGKKRAAHLVHLHDPQYTSKKDALRSIRGTVQLKLGEM